MNANSGGHENGPRVGKAARSFLLGLAVGCAVGGSAAYIWSMCSREAAGPSIAAPIGAQGQSWQALRDQFRDIMIPLYRMEYAEAKDALRAVFGDVIVETDLERGVPKSPELIKAIRSAVPGVESVRSVVLAHGMIGFAKATWPVKVIGLDLRAQKRHLEQCPSVDYVGPWELDGNSAAPPKDTAQPARWAILSADSVARKGQGRAIGKDMFLTVVRWGKHPSLYSHQRVRVQGIFDTGKFFGRQTVFMDLETTRRFVLQPSACSEIWIRFRGDGLSESELAAAVGKVSAALQRFRRSNPSVNFGSLRARSSAERYGERLEPFRSQLQLAESLYEATQQP